MSEVEKAGIRRSVARAADAPVAALQLCGQLTDPDPAMVLVFSTPEIKSESLAREVTRRFPNCPVIGCTTAGEITPAGYEEGCVTAVSLPRSAFAVAAQAIDGLADFSPGRIRDAAASLKESVHRSTGRLDAGRLFTMVLIDGLSVQEEAFVSALSHAMGDVPVFGGSAGDGLRFRSTSVLNAGEYRSSRAVVALVQTDLPFRVFKTQHFVPKHERMVVTEADAASRLVRQINAERAAIEYARCVGVDVSELGPDVFATNPVVVRVGGEVYVRSIQRMNPDMSLTFYCAIGEGIVLTLARGLDLVENLRSTFASLRSEIGDLNLVLGCDCILRRLEAQRSGALEDVSRLLTENNVIGFSTYGEQWNAMHVNQTLTGVAIGSGA